MEKYKNLWATMRSGVNDFCDAIISMVENDQKKFDSFVDSNRTKEQQCDREIENIFSDLMANKEPHFMKGDRMRLVDMVDRIIDLTEVILQDLRATGLKPPNELSDDLKTMVKQVQDTVTNLEGLLLEIDSDIRNAIKKSDEVEDLRRGVRQKEWVLLNKLFELSKDPLETILTRDLIHNIARVADKAEGCSDFIRTLGMKYIVLR